MKYNNIDVIDIRLFDQIVIDNKDILYTEYEVLLSNGDIVILGENSIKKEIYDD